MNLAIHHIQEFKTEFWIPELETVLSHLQKMQMQGRHEKAMLGRKIAFAIHDQVFDFLNFEDDSVFLDPRLFSLHLDYSYVAEIRTLIATRSLGIQKIPTMISYENDHVIVPKIEALNISQILPEAELNLDVVQLVRQAASLIRNQLPLLFERLIGSWCFTLPLTHLVINSMAHESYPGVIFLNTHDEVSITSLVEDIVHQATHCFYSDIEASSGFEYRVNPENQLNQYIQGPSDERTISVLYHSALTESLSIIALSMLCHSSFQDDQVMTEAVARIGFLEKKLAIDLKYIERVNGLQCAARQVYLPVLGVATRILNVLKYTTSTMRFQEQGYNFSMETFLKENPEFA